MSGSELTCVGWQEIKLARQQGLDRSASSDIVRTWGVIMDDMGGRRRALNKGMQGFPCILKRLF